MKVGFVGLGKLGMPVALALDHKGHDVMGYDIDPSRMQKEQLPAPRDRAERRALDRAAAAREPDPLRLARRGRRARRDRLRRRPDAARARVRGVDAAPRRAGRLRLHVAEGRRRRRSPTRSGEQGEDRIVIVISTVLPGTVRREILPLVNDHVKLCYNPFFIAMGTTIRDFLDPEFVLFGMRDPEAAEKAKELYATLHDRPLYETSIENAELIKVAYNTYITMKVCFANTLMEICAQDGGVRRRPGERRARAERPEAPEPRVPARRDGRRRRLPSARQHRALVARARARPVVRLVRGDHARPRAADRLARRPRRGASRPPGSRSARSGSTDARSRPARTSPSGARRRCSRTCSRSAASRSSIYDPHIDDGPCPFVEAGVYVVATCHDEFAAPDWEYPAGSVVIDPWRIVPRGTGIEVVHVGVGRGRSSSGRARELSIADEHSRDGDGSVEVKALRWRLIVRPPGRGFARSPWMRSGVLGHASSGGSGVAPKPVGTRELLRRGGLSTLLVEPHFCGSPSSRAGRGDECSKSGVGSEPTRFALRRPARQLTAVELSEQSLDLARRRAAGLPLRIASISTAQMPSSWQTSCRGSPTISSTPSASFTIRPTQSGQSNRSGEHSRSTATACSS